LKIKGVESSMNITAGQILHVDDDESVRWSTSMLLRTTGYGIASAANGTEALQWVKEGLSPDVLIVDFHLGSQRNVWLTSKPLNPELLLAALPNLVNLSRTTRILASRSAPSYV
jgi:PleD family two-component response regulator